MDDIWLGLAILFVVIAILGMRDDDDDFDVEDS